MSWEGFTGKQAVFEELFPAFPDLDTGFTFELHVAGFRIE
jgi:hypothetical protein